MESCGSDPGQIAGAWTTARRVNVICLTGQGRKRNTARHHPRENSAPASAEPNHHTDTPNTGSAKRSELSVSRMPDERELAEIADRLRRAVAPTPGLACPDPEAVRRVNLADQVGKRTHQ